MTLMAMISNGRKRSGGSALAASRSLNLTKGLNVEGWDVIGNEYSTNTMLNALWDYGFRSIRSGYEASSQWVTMPGDVTNMNLTCHVRAFDFYARAIAIGFRVIMTPVFRDYWAADATRKSQFVSLYSTWAAQVNTRYDPEYAFIELPTEPNDPDNATWAAYEKGYADAVRAAAPNHTMVSCGLLGQVSGLLTYTPTHTDKNMIYSVHQYVPTAFTFQGSTIVPDFDTWTDVPWPAPTGTALTATKAKNDASESATLDWYSTTADGRDATLLSSSLVVPAKNWGTTNGFPVIVTEFGAQEPAPRLSRVNFIKTMKDLCVTNGLGYFMWQLKWGYGLQPKGDLVTTILDSPIIEALGLTPWYRNATYNGKLVGTDGTRYFVPALGDSILSAGYFAQTSPATWWNTAGTATVAYAYQQATITATAADDRIYQVGASLVTNAYYQYGGIFRRGTAPGSQLWVQRDSPGSFAGIEFSSTYTQTAQNVYTYIYFKAPAADFLAHITATGAGTVIANELTMQPMLLTVDSNGLLPRREVSATAYNDIKAVLLAGGAIDSSGNAL